MEEPEEQATVQTEEPVPNIVFVRAKKKKDKKFAKDVIQAAMMPVTAIVAVLGIIISYNALTIIRDEKAARKKDAFIYAIEHLSDKSLAIRVGALFELEKLGLEFEEEQESIVRILGPFIREGIENRSLLQTTDRRDAFPDIPDSVNPPRPQEDIFVACEIASQFFMQTGCRLSLEYLKIENVDLTGIQLKGANLFCSQFTDVRLTKAQLQKADLGGLHFYDLSLDDANLQGANLFAARFYDISAGNVNLQGVDLFDAWMEKAFLSGANLQGADLRRAKLQEADLYQAQFRGAKLYNANLNGADLSGTDLQGAIGLEVQQLLGAEFNEYTLLDEDLRDDPYIQARIAKIKAQQIN